MPDNAQFFPDADLTVMLQDLASPEPDIRDGDSLNTLCEAIDAGLLSKSQRDALGEALLERLGHPRVEARSFAALVLGPLVLAGSGRAE